jgi:tetratricopeptide (TPR) repeat protein
MNALKKICCLVAILLPMTLWAVTPEQQVADANRAYYAGHYENAVTIYEKVTQAGFASPVLFYNLGNAYFKLGNMPMAILYYEKAHKLAPADADIAHNILLANARIVDKIEPVPVLFYIRWWTQARNILSPDNFAKASLALFSFFWLLLTFYFLARRRGLRITAFYFSLLFLCAAIFGMILASDSHHHALTPDEAIVMEPSAGVKSSPDDKSVALFVIHEGTKVTVMDRIGNWKEVRIANGNSGWIQTKAIREI